MTPTRQLTDCALVILVTPKSYSLALGPVLSSKYDDKGELNSQAGSINAIILPHAFSPHLRLPLT